MSKVGLIYRSLWLYRMIMNVLYTAGYKNRFEKVILVLKKLKPSQVVELCFADIFIAEYCKSKGIGWQGFDSNEYFVKRARSKGFNAENIDLSVISKLPKADAYVIMGSLYHFSESDNNILAKMLESSNKIIISEPIKNLSDQKGVIGWIAKKMSNAGKGDEGFRYNITTFKEMLEAESLKLNFTFTVVDFYKKDIIVVIEKNGTD
jgi:hypothetical protein